MLGDPGGAAGDFWGDDLLGVRFFQSPKTIVSLSSLAKSKIVRSLLSY